MSAPDPHAPTTSVLFVCLGNICRSPLAEGVFLDRVTRAGLQSRFDIDSAGTGAWHVGERPDPRAISVADRHGVALPSRARQITETDLERFDWIIAMDRDNLHAIRGIAHAAGSDANIHLLRDFDPMQDGDEVPDPYYGGSSGFDTVYEMVARSCDALLAHLTR